MGKNEDKMTAKAMERMRKEREEKAKKKASGSYSYSHIKDLGDDAVRKIKMNKGGKVKGYGHGGNVGGECRGGGAATQGKGFKGTF